MRRDLEQLVEMLRAIDGLDIALTTNGSLLPRRRRGRSRTRGCSRVTVSLDSLDDAVFRAMNDVDFPVDARARRHRRRRGGRACRSRSTWSSSAASNEDSDRRDGAALHAARGHILRFIEFMDVGATNGWRHGRRRLGEGDRRARSTPSSRSSRSRPNYRGEVAKRWRYTDGSGEIGIIASVTQPFCGDCTPRPALGRRQALHLPVRRRAATTCARLAARRRDRRRARRRRDRAPIWAAAPTATPSCAPRHDRPAQGRDVVHRRLSQSSPASRIDGA